MFWGFFFVFVIFVCVINLKMDLLFVSEIYVSHVQCTLMFMNMKNHDEWLYDDARCLTICVGVCKFSEDNAFIKYL